MPINRGLVNPHLLTNIADAIRYKLSTDNKYKLADMPNAINSIQGGSSAIDYAILPASGFNMGSKIENIFFLIEEPTNELKNSKTLFGLPGGERAWSYQNGNNFYIYPDKNCNYSFYGSMDNAFNYCGNLRQGIYTSNAITNMRNAYRSCSVLKGQPQCSDTIVDMTDAYKLCYSINGIAACGNKVIYYDNTYSNCYNLSEAYVGPNVKYMGYTFSYCRNIKNAVVNNNVLMMQYAYNYCSNLNSEPVCGPNTTHFFGTYNNCTKLSGNPVCGSEVLYFEDCYRNCSNLTGIPVCGDKVVNMMGTYLGCYNITGNPVCGPEVNNMYQTYYACYNLTGEPVCEDKVLNMDQTYYNCQKISGNPKVGPKVSKLHQTYYNCTNLTGEPVSSLKISYMYETYYNCVNLTGTPVFSNNNDLSQIENCYYNCQKLSGGNIYLMQQQIGSYWYFSNALYNFNTNNRLNFFVLRNRIWDNTFKRNTGSYSIIGKTITYQNISDEELPETIEDNSNCPITSGYYNSLYNIYIYQAAGIVNMRSLSWANSNTTSIIINNGIRGSLPSRTNIADDSYEPAVGGWDNTNYYIDMYAKQYKWSYSCNNMFLNCYNLILNLSDFYGDGFAWTKVNKFWNIFMNCQNIYGEPFCPDNVDYMYQSYYGCSNITGKAACGNLVQNMDYAYTNCFSLQEATSGPNVNSMICTYLGCHNLKNATCGNNVQYLNHTYENCYNLKNAVCENNVYSLDNAYRNCFNLITAVCGPSVADMENAYAGCTNLTKAVCGQNVRTFRNAYNGCNNITGSIKLGPNIYDKMNGCFYGCDKLQTIYIPNISASYGYSFNSFYRTNYDIRQNIIVNYLGAYNSYKNYGNIICNSIFGNESTTPDYSTIEVEGEDISVVRYCYNLEHNIYLYCTV